MEQHKKIAFLFLLVITTLGCKKKENLCPDQFLEDTLLSDTTITYVSSYISASKVIFNDISSGEEIEFLISEYKDTLLTATTAFRCEEDSTIFATFKANSQWINVVLSNPSLPRDIIIKVTQLPFYDSEEEMILLYGLVENTQINYLDVSGLLAFLPQAEEPVFAVKSDSLLIDNKTFYDVIEPNPDFPGFNEPFNPPLEIKYSKSQGIIYMNDNINSRELVFNRME